VLLVWGNTPLNRRLMAHGGFEIGTAHISAFAPFIEYLVECDSIGCSD
jgi:hypothetical protein